MSKRWWVVFLAASMALQALAFQALAGPVGAGLGKAGFNDEVQNAGDALANELAAAATNGESVRGASGVLGEIALNSGTLICSAWIISFNIQIKKMVMASLHMEGDALNQQLQLIQQATDFMAKLSKACGDAGFAGVTGPAGGVAPGGGGTGVATDGGTAEQPHTPTWQDYALPGETIADTICRRKCDGLYQRMLAEQRELVRTQEIFDRVNAQAQQDQQDLAKMESDLAQAQKDKEAATKILRTPITGTPTPAQERQLTEASNALRNADFRIRDLNSKIPKQREKAAKSAQDVPTWQRILEGQIAKTEAAVAAYNRCLKDCLRAAQAAGERTTIQVSQSSCALVGAAQNCSYDAPSTAQVFETVPLSVDPRVCYEYVGGGYDMIPVESGGNNGGPPLAGFVPAGAAGTPLSPLTPGDIPPGQGPAIPADFFGPGSGPFAGEVALQSPPGGVPADTGVKRAPQPSGALQPVETIPIQLVQLSLQSSAPITVPAPSTQPETMTPPNPPFYIVKAEKSVLEGGKAVTKPVEGAVAKLGFPPPPLPGAAARTAESTNRDHDKDPRQAVTDENGFGVILADGFGPPEPIMTESPALDASGLNRVKAGGLRVDMTPMASRIVYLGAGVAVDGTNGKTELPQSVQPYVVDRIPFGNVVGAVIAFPAAIEGQIMKELAGFWVQVDPCREKEAADPYFTSKGSWGQPYDDQWAIKHVGYTAGKSSAWVVAGAKLSPVVVAVIDTGLDWNHADISWDNLWQNPGEIPDNGIDDDANGYVDDVIGWDFVSNTNKPWDQDGHGTFIAGVIAAAKDNGIGIAGINPAAKIMVVKALNDFGNTYASRLAKAIKYAADNGAKVINLSVGGEGLTALERMAVEYANAKGAVVVVAAGNKGTEVADFGLAPYPEVVTVGATDLDDQRPVFSNYGSEVDLAAPGIEVLSLRARRTDLMRDIPGVGYEPGSAYVGADKRYYRSSGTSFSAPIVSGTASLILAMNPNLTNEEVKRMIVQSARDIETPGIDQFTGYGLVDAAAALQADPAFEIEADISGIEVIQDNGQTAVAVNGTAAADRFARANVSIGPGENPASFREVGTVAAPVEGGRLALIPANEFRAAPVWTIRLAVTHANGKTRERRFTLTLE